MVPSLLCRVRRFPGPGAAGNEDEEDNGVGMPRCWPVMETLVWFMVVNRARGVEEN